MSGIDAPAKNNSGMFANGGGAQFPPMTVYSKNEVQIVFAFENEEVQGTYNCCAPNPIPNRDLMKEFRRKLRVPFAVPQPAWLIELGTRLCGTEAELVLKSRNVFPRKMLNAGFRFTHPRLPEALKTLTL